MRIRFAPRTDSEEGSERRALLARVETFSLKLGEMLPAIATASRRGPEETARLERMLTAEVNRITTGLHVELGIEPGSDPMVVLAPQDDAPLEPLISEILARAPRDPRVAIVRHRPPLPLERALADVKARTGTDLSNGRARIGFGRGHLLEVVVYSPSFASAADPQALAAADLLLPRILGDSVFDDWVGSVDVAPLPRGGPLRVLNDAPTSLDATLPLVEVFTAVEVAIRGVDAALPHTPYHAFCEQAEWTMLELEPALAEDYAAQDDLAMLSTMVPEAMKCFLQGARFSSRRFSREKESFAYVKIDASAKSVQARHELGVELEDALNVALVPGGFGCVVGSGLGARYVYVELALTNIDHGVRITRHQLAKLGVGPRAWILFCDSGWRDEWVGATDDTPPAYRPPTPTH